MTDIQLNALLSIGGFCIIVAIIGIVFQDRLAKNFEASADGDSGDGGDGGGGD